MSVCWKTLLFQYLVIIKFCWKHPRKDFTYKLVRLLHTLVITDKVLIRYFSTIFLLRRFIVFIFAYSIDHTHEKWTIKKQLFIIEFLRKKKKVCLERPSIVNRLCIKAPRFYCVPGPIWKKQANRVHEICLIIIYYCYISIV